MCDRFRAKSAKLERFIGLSPVTDERFLPEMYLESRFIYQEVRGTSTRSCRWASSACNEISQLAMVFNAQVAMELLRKLQLNYCTSCGNCNQITTHVDSFLLFSGWTRCHVMRELLYQGARVIRMRSCRWASSTSRRKSRRRRWIPFSTRCSSWTRTNSPTSSSSR